MKFKESDYDWSDWHLGLSPKRNKRFYKVIDAVMDELEKILKKHHRPGQYLQASVPIGLFSTGVRGDKRAYAPIVMIFYDEWRGHNYLEELSKDITNKLPVSRVIATSFKLTPIP